MSMGIAELTDPEVVTNSSPTQDGGRVDIGSGDGEGPPVFDKTPLFVVAGLCAVACLSQLITVFIAGGLVGDYSAKTFLWVQAVGQMLQQLFIMQFALCGSIGGVFCLQRISRHSCKMVIYLGGVFFLLPDYLAMPVALDRINAVRLPMWYKEWCSQRNAWVVIGPICAFLLAIAVPKSAGSDLIGGDCVTLYERYDQFLSLMGIPAVVTVVISTSILLLLLKQKKEVITAANSADSQTQRPITLALTVNSVVFAISGILQYLLLFVAFLIRDPNNRAQGVSLLAIGQILGSAGVIIRGPVLLVMRPMRKAFVRGVKRLCCHE
ncbi:uncharacterized protein LOC142336548 [Convolutriloba macropyga]|uniref:uncharacterized protein LOC142336548 n=1 Tax=Convolutriloba macropyga TaxID=536237 RepID=UPI003F524A9F